MSTFTCSVGRAAVAVFLAVFSSSLLAQGVGALPRAEAGYTPGSYGYSPPAVPSSTDLLSSAPVTQGCNWSAIYGNGTSENFAYPEANATYWQASLPEVNAAGTVVRIDGRYSNARFSSLSLYNSSYQLLGTLSDYLLMPSMHGVDPFEGKTQRKPGVAYGGTFTAYVMFGTAPAQPAANTLYVAPQLGPYGASLPSVQQLYLMYRVYVPQGGTASGDVPLPALSINGTPFSSQTDSLYCQNLTTDFGQSLLYAVPLTPGQTALSAPANPAFTLYTASGGVGVNGDNQYMYADATLPAGYLYIVRAKAPTHTDLSAVTADVRYWSICQNTESSLEVVACVGDFQALLDAEGYFNIVVTNDSSAPSYALGYSWMPFGPRSPATVIYRQLLAADGFAGASGGTTMGSYTPQLAYCQVSKFQSLVAQSNTPRQVFEACGGPAD